MGCTISSTIGDQLDVNPQIAPLRYNGGPTYTHRLLAGSPAIDGGNPDGCLDQLGNPLTTDQRGFTRPLDGNGDGVRCVTLEPTSMTRCILSYRLSCRW